MRKILILPALLMATGAGAVEIPNIGVAIENARAACSGISGDMEHLKKMAGISTAVAVGGMGAGGVAFVAGGAKADVDKDIEEFLKTSGQIATQQLTLNGDGTSGVNSGNSKLDELRAESKKLGNIRTGALAVNTATGVAGAIISGTNRVKGDLEDRINECRDSVKVLGDAYMQARMDDAKDSRLFQAEAIMNACGKWNHVDISKINKKATGAAITSGVGATVGLAGTVTSAMANSDKVRDDETDAGKQKEKNMNTAANAMALGATVTSGVATILNATQVKAIKNAVEVADKCEEVL